MIVEIVNGGGRAPPPPPPSPWDYFTLMMECAPESGHCHRGGKGRGETKSFSALSVGEYITTFLVMVTLTSIRERSPVYCREYRLVGPGP